MATFGERFRQERNLRGLTQEQLANKFYLNKSSISRYEKNSQIPEMPTLEKFADFFGVSLDYLLGKTDFKNTENKNIKTDAEKDIEELLEETMQQQGLMLNGEIVDENDLILLRQAIKNGIEYAKSMKEIKDKNKK